MYAHCTRYGIACATTAFGRTLAVDAGLIDPARCWTRRWSPRTAGWKEIYMNGPPTGMHLPHVDSHTAMVTIHFWVVSPIFFKMWHAQCSTRRVTGVIAA